MEPAPVEKRCAAFVVAEEAKPGLGRRGDGVEEFPCPTTRDLCNGRRWLFHPVDPHQRRRAQGPTRKKFCRADSENFENFAPANGIP